MQAGFISKLNENVVCIHDVNSVSKNTKCEETTVITS